ncbi:MAG TPA: hypothetical protein VLH09_00575, partial [Bryobacteraceae bacterium]|nr:hypothetical protein [Bryobacteraceae bacterium]
HMVIPARLIPDSRLAAPLSLLTASVVTFYTAPDRSASTEKTRAYIRRLTLTNTSAVDETVTIYLVPRGDTAGAANMLVSALSVPAGKTAVVREAEGHILEPGGTIQAVKGAAPGSAVTIMASGVEFR